MRVLGKRQDNCAGSTGGSDQCERLVKCSEVKCSWAKRHEDEISCTEMGRRRGRSDRGGVYEQDSVAVIGRLMLRLVDSSRRDDHRMLLSARLRPGKSSPLRVGVDDGDTLAGEHRRYGKMDSNGRFNGASFLCRDSDRPHALNLTTACRGAAMPQTRNDALETRPLARREKQRDGPRGSARFQVFHTPAIGQRRRGVTQIGQSRTDG